MEFCAPIEVGIRLRPVLPSDDPPSDERVEVLDTGQLTVEQRVFDVSFSLAPQVSQQQLYSATVQPLVDTLLQGYNVAVMCFGQAGAGKSYTLIGPDALFAMCEMDFGIIPRATRHVFAHLHNTQRTGELCDHSMSVSCSCIEIIDDQVIDLLSDDASACTVSVHMDQKGGVSVHGAREVQCLSVPDVLHCVESSRQLQQSLTGDSTASGDDEGGEQVAPSNRHRRSHTVFSLRLHQQWTDQMCVRHSSSGVMRCVELCCSDLVPAADDPDDFTIDAGLLALKHVIDALVYRSTDVPYHCHPLTTVLKDVVGGNCKTLMLCCISPADTDESLHALQYVEPLRSVNNWLQRNVAPANSPLPAASAASVSFRSVDLPLDRTAAPQPPPSTAGTIMRQVNPVPPFQQHCDTPPSAQRATHKPSFSGHLESPTRQVSSVAAWNTSMPDAGANLRSVQQQMQLQHQLQAQHQQLLLQQSQLASAQLYNNNNNNNNNNTCSPPLTELSFQRATLHESLLLDLYRRMHVLEAQQAAVVNCSARAQHHNGVGGASSVFGQSAVASGLRHPSVNQSEAMNEIRHRSSGQSLGANGACHSAVGQSASTEFAREVNAARSNTPSAVAGKSHEETVFQLKFATEQYRQLVSGAEALLRELSISQSVHTDSCGDGRNGNDERCGRIEAWLCRKLETDECLQPALVEDSVPVKTDRQKTGVASLQSPTERNCSPGCASANITPGSPTPTLTSAPHKTTSSQCSHSVSESCCCVTENDDIRAVLVTSTPVSRAGRDLVSSGHQPDNTALSSNQPTENLSLAHTECKKTLDDETVSNPAVTSASVTTASVTAAGVRVSSRRRQACTGSDIRLMRESDEICRLWHKSSEMVVAQVDNFTANTPPTQQQQQQQQATLPPSGGDLFVTNKSAELSSLSVHHHHQQQEHQYDDTDKHQLMDRGCMIDSGAIRREIGKLRECREVVLSRRQDVISQSQNVAVDSAAICRQLLELDEAVHVLDDVIETKNVLLCGNSDVNSAMLAPPGGGSQLWNNCGQLWRRLLQLAEPELRALYCRNFQRLIDCRVDGREKDILVAELDAQVDGHKTGVKRLQAMMHELMRERAHYKRQRDQLRRQLNQLSTAASWMQQPTSSAAAVMDSCSAAAVNTHMLSARHSDKNTASSRLQAHEGSMEVGYEEAEMLSSSHNHNHNQRATLRQRVLRGLLTSSSHSQQQHQQQQLAAEMSPLSLASSSVAAGSRVTRQLNGRVVIQAAGITAHNLSAPTTNNNNNNADRKPRR